MRLPRGVDTRLFFLAVGFLSSLLMTGCSTPGGAGATTVAQVDALVQEGSRLSIQGEYAKSIETLDRAIEINPQRASQQLAYAWRSRSQREKGGYEQALADANHQLEWDQDNAARANSIILRARAYAAMHDYDRAIEDYSQAIAWDPQPPHYLLRGYAYVESEQWEQAVADLTTTLDPANTAKVDAWFRTQWQSDALWQRGLAYCKLGKMEAARADALRIKEMVPRRAPVMEDERFPDYFERTKRTGIVAEAIVAGGKAEGAGNFLAAFQSYQRAYAWAFLTTEEMDQALAGMLRLYPKLPARPAVPEEVRRFAIQADTAAGEQKYAEAAVLYGKALDAAPWWPKGRYNLAQLKAQQNDFAGAIAEMEQYLALAPGAPDTREAKDLIYQWQYKQQSVAKK